MFQFSWFRFHFVSTNILEGLCVYLDCYYNEFSVKQTAALYLKFPLRLAFFSVRFLFLERLLFAYFILSYFWINRLNLAIKGGEGDIFSKALIICFCLEDEN